MFLGLIAILFPKAKIIYVKRNVMDNATAIFFKYLDQLGAPFSNRWQDIVSYFSSTAKLMAHWKKVLPIDIIEVEYEEFLEDPANETKALFRNVNLKIEKQTHKTNSQENKKEIGLWKIIKISLHQYFKPYQIKVLYAH